MISIETEMHKLVNEIDEVLDNKIKKIIEDNEKISSFSKIWPFN